MATASGVIVVLGAALLATASGVVVSVVVTASVVVSVVPAQPTLRLTPAPKRRLRFALRRRRERGPERWLRWAIIVVAIIMLCHIQRRQGKQQQKTPHAGGGSRYERLQWERLQWEVKQGGADAFLTTATGAAAMGGTPSTCGSADASLTTD